MRQGAVFGLLAAMAFAGAAHADEPPYEGDPNWSMRALLGYSKTGGNTDNSAGNALFHVAHLMGDWKILFGTEALYGSTHGETTAQAFTIHGQLNYNFTPKFYGYVGAGYSDDRFSGFAYQDAVTSGVGYQIFNDDHTKLTVQGGVGYLWLRKEYLVKDDIGGVIERLDYDPTTGIPYEQQSSVAFNGAVSFEHNFNASTKLLAGVGVLSSSDNTRTAATVALQVKMSTRFALAAGYQITNNSKPPGGSGKNDSLLTVSLVYDMKNPKLAPE
jgi:putative salt-induced outer membrane protein YdiY